MITETRRVRDRVEEIFALAPGRSDGATRPAFSREEADAMQLVAGWAREIYLEPAVDPHGNLWCLPPGEEPVVTSDSHVDIVPRGGAPVGVRPLPRSPLPPDCSWKRGPLSLSPRTSTPEALFVSLCRWR